MRQVAQKPKGIACKRCLSWPQERIGSDHRQPTDQGVVKDSTKMPRSYVVKKPQGG